MRTELETRLQNAVWRLLGEAKCPDGFPEANNGERASHLAPRLARALDAHFEAVWSMSDAGVDVPFGPDAEDRAAAADTFLRELYHD